MGCGRAPVEGRHGLRHARAPAIIQPDHVRSMRTEPRRRLLAGDVDAGPTYGTSSESPGRTRVKRTGTDSTPSPPSRCRTRVNVDVARSLVPGKSSR